VDELRAAIAAVPPPPPEMAGLLAKVRDRAYTVTDADVEELKAHFSEDEIFEQVVAAAISEGLRRFDRAAAVVT
jgi:alkylhydroperoxidase family enzyme